MCGRYILCDVGGTFYSDVFGTFTPDADIGGAITGLAEAFASGSDEPSRPPTADNDAGPPPIHYGLVLAPTDVTEPLVTNNSDPKLNETASEIRRWPGSARDHLVDMDTQIWWPGRLHGERKGYEGVWGVRCTDDGFGLRSSITFPDFKKALFESLIADLST